ncbi:MAG: Meiotic recombination protein dmc1 [Watsoniomyces obsoletus]|nr:MAG: Meiotic recombination protein dmc1 [Watsoniomyces obsoletus]
MPPLNSNPFGSAADVSDWEYLSLIHRTEFYRAHAENFRQAATIGQQGIEFIKQMTMSSSLARRACYKCGTVGHFAEVCTSTERLCYNCKQPAKQCYHCQGIGHVQAACPTLRLAGTGIGGPCYHCGLPGHLARNCPNGALQRGVGRGAGPPRGGYGPYRGGGAGFVSGPRTATCYRCGGPNHFARDCQAQGTKCYACGRLGHISRECTAPNGGPLSMVGKKCYRCGDAGHISRDCQQAEQTADGAPATTNNAAATTPAPATAVAQTPPPAAAMA